MNLYDYLRATRECTPAVARILDNHSGTLEDQLVSVLSHEIGPRWFLWLGPRLGLMDPTVDVAQRAAQRAVQRTCSLPDGTAPLTWSSECAKTAHIAAKAAQRAAESKDKVLTADAMDSAVRAVSWAAQALGADPTEARKSEVATQYADIRKLLFPGVIRALREQGVSDSDQVLSDRHALHNVRLEIEEAYAVLDGLDVPRLSNKSLADHIIGLGKIRSLEVERTKARLAELEAKVARQDRQIARYRETIRAVGAELAHIDHEECQGVGSGV